MRAIGRSGFGLLIAATLLAQSPPDSVIQFLRSAANALSNAHDDGNAQQFLDHFDHGMPGYPALHDALEELVTRAEVGSAIEVASDSGDEKKRTLELDWVLDVTDQSPRRKILKCTIERKGKNWKFTSLTPVEFFKY